MSSISELTILLSSSLFFFSGLLPKPFPFCAHLLQSECPIKRIAGPEIAYPFAFTENISNPLRALNYGRKRVMPMVTKTSYPSQRLCSATRTLLFTKFLNLGRRFSRIIPQLAPPYCPFFMIFLPKYKNLRRNGNPARLYLFRGG